MGLSPTSLPNGLYQYPATMGLAYQIMNGMTVSVGSCAHTAAQYGAQGVAWIEAAMAGLQSGKCSGGACNGTTNPPYYGNDMRNLVTYAALSYDYLFPLLTSTDITNLGTVLYQCEHAFITPPGIGGNTIYGLNQAYAYGVGAASNGHAGMYAGFVLAGEATYGDGVNPTDTNTGCVYGETQCNEGTTGFLNEWLSNDVNWFTLQASQRNAYPALNGCGLPVSQVNVTAACPGSKCFLTTDSGGDGCAAGGFPEDGIEYGPTTQSWSVAAIDLISGADSSTNIWNVSAPTYSHDLANFLIYDVSPWTSALAWPTAATHELMNYSDQQTPFRFTGVNHIAALILGAHEGSTTLGNYLRNYYRNLYPYSSDYPNDNNNKPFFFWDILYDNETLATTNPLTVSSFPLDYVAPGGIILFRSDTTANAFWSGFFGTQKNDNHAQSEDGTLKFGYKGQWLALNPPGYGGQGPPWCDPGIKNLMTFQSTNEIGAGNIWRGPKCALPGSSQPQWIAQEIDPNSKFVHVWWDLTGDYGAGIASGFTVHSTNSIFTGTGPNDMVVFTGLGPTQVGAENVYTITVAANGTPDTFNWSCSAATPPAVSAGCSGGASGSGVAMSTSGNHLGTGSQAEIKWTTTTGHAVGDQWVFFADNWGPWTNLSKYQREEVYIKNAAFPYIVVLDRAQTLLNTNLRFNLSLPYSGSLPINTANVVQSTNNGESLFAQAVYPSSGIASSIQDFATIPELWAGYRTLMAANDYNGTISNTAVSPIAGIKFAKANIQTVTASTAPILITVMQAADSTINATPVESITGGGLNCAHIKDTTQDQVACFTSDAGGALINLTSPISYSLTRAASSAQHFIFDLPASTTVKVQVSETGSNSTVTISNASGTGTAFTTSSQGSLVIPDPLTGGALTIQTISLAMGIKGLGYGQTLTATGGTPPYTWSIASGSLPTGLSLNSSTGGITGTPSQNTANVIQFSVSDSGSVMATVSLTLAISAAVEIVTTTLPNGTQSAAYSQQISVTGGNLPYVCSVIGGSLPGGISIANNSTGCLLAGTPSATGTYNFTIEVADSTVVANSGPSTISQALSILVVTPISILPSILPCGQLNAAYPVTTLTASGGSAPYTWAIVSGSLPPGMSLSTGGILSGTPTTRGQFVVTIQVTDSNGIDQQANYNLTIGSGSSCTNCVLMRTVLQ